MLSVVFNQSKVFGTPRVLLSEFIAFASGFYNYLYVGIDGSSHRYLWSLALEEQFYVFLLTLFIIFPSNRKKLFLSTGLILVIALIIRPLSCRFDGICVGQLTHVRFDVPLFGVLLALLNPPADLIPDNVKSKRISRYVVVPLLTLLLLGYVGLLHPHQETELFIHHLAILSFSLAAAALVYLASLDRRYVFEFPIISTVLKYLGSRSYCLYVAHMTAYHILLELRFRYRDVIPNWVREPGLGWATQIFTALGLALILSELIHQAVEIPFSYARRRDAIRTQPSSKIEPTQNGSLASV